MVPSPAHPAQLLPESASKTRQESPGRENLRRSRKDVNGDDRLISGVHGRRPKAANLLLLLFKEGLAAGPVFMPSCVESWFHGVRKATDRPPHLAHLFCKGLQLRPVMHVVTIWKESAGQRGNSTVSLVRALIDRFVLRRG